MRYELVQDGLTTRLEKGVGVTASIGLGLNDPQLAFAELQTSLKGMNDPVVQRFVRDHPEPLAVLAEVPSVIARLLGPDALMSEVVYCNPEASAHEELYVLIHTSLPPDKALRQLSAFDKEWWLDALPRVDGKLTITLEAA